MGAARIIFKPGGVDVKLKTGRVIIVPKFGNVLVTQKYFEAPTVPVFDPMYQALLDRATLLGYTLPNPVQQVKQNQFVLDLRAAGILTSLDTLKFEGNNGSKEFGTLNLITPTLYQSLLIGNPTWTSDLGFNSNGTSSYINDNWAPSDGVNYKLNDACYGVVIQNNVAEDNKYDFGTAPNFTGGPDKLWLISSDNFGSCVYGLNTTSTAVAANASQQGFFMIQRSGANISKVFKNGVQIGATSGVVSTGLSTAKVFQLCVNNGGSPANFTTRKLGLSFAGASLVGKEAAFYAAWQTYITP